MIDINPFEKVTIGTPINSLGNFNYQINVLEKRNITRRQAYDHAERTMRGLSDRVHTTHMNQASIGVAGSYGVEGVQKVTSAVTAYFGYSSAQLSKQLSVVYEIIRTGGYELINFNRLTPLHMLELLEPSTKGAAEEALDRYNELMEKLDQIEAHPYVKAIEWSIPQVFDAFPRPPIDPKLDPREIEANHVRLKSLATLVADARDLKKKWADAASRFRRNFGEGVVVGVLLGGIGQATMTIVNKAQAAAWKYGGDSRFSYASDLASVTVEATYDASGTTDISQVTVECKGIFSGKCVQAQVTSWTDKLDGKAYEEVAKFAPLKAPVIALETSLPNAPDFVEPTKAKKKTKQVTKGKVETAAKLATYDKAEGLFKKAYPDKDFGKSINEFIDRATEKPKTEPMPMKHLADRVASNRLSTRSLLEK